MPISDEGLLPGTRSADRAERRLRRAFLAVSLLALATTIRHWTSAAPIPIALAILFSAAGAVGAALGKIRASSTLAAAP